MVEILEDVINSKKNNIGSLCLYLRKRPKLIDELNNILDKRLMDLTLPQKIWCYVNYNYQGNDIFCLCGEMKKWKDFKTGWRETCGKPKCFIEQRKLTNILTYGTDNPMKNENIKDKTKQTNIIKYGFDVPSKNKEIRNKISKVLNDRNEKEKIITKNKKIINWNNKTKEEKEIIKEKIKKTNKGKSKKELEKIAEKRKDTCLTKYNSEYTVTSKTIRKKILKKFNKKYGGDSPFSSIEVQLKSKESYKKRHINTLNEKLKKFECEYVSHIDKGSNFSNIEYTLKCLRKNELFNISYTNLRIRILSGLEISPFFRKEHGVSYMEKELLGFISNNYKKEIISNSNNIINPYEIDIYLPDLKIAFEFNGLYWHSEIQKENNYHLNKTEDCEKLGIKLIQIYEDDWLYKQDIVKSRILNLLGKSNKIFARKCEIKEIEDNKLVREFLEKNHIQGFIGSKIKVGLFHNDELVSLMSFGNLRKPLGQNSKENTFELLRFCNKLNTNVIGGASKLFNYILDKYKPIEIVSYADRSWSSGGLYYHLGFKMVHKTEPNYYYIIDNMRRHRFNYRKDILVKKGFDKNLTEHEIMLKNGNFRIYDSGNLKFIYS